MELMLNTKSRLRKKNKRIITSSRGYTILDNIALKSGDVITFSARTVNNGVWFQIIHNSRFCKSSYYDGPDFDRACDLFLELLLAFCGVKKAEEFSNAKEVIKDKSNLLIQMQQRPNVNDIKRKQMFLGLD
mgnify:CR=1 FL=1